MIFILEIVTAYLLADLATGLYHLATDRGWNIKSQVDLFQDHHKDPTGIGRDIRPAIAGVPLALLAFFGWYPAFFTVFGMSVTFCQMPHYWTHHRGNALIRALQKAHLILSPKHHAVHHRDDFNKNFCTLSGWNNPWLNQLVRKKNDGHMGAANV